MIHFLGRYIYFGSLLVWMSMHAAGYIVFPSQRRSMLAASLGATPQAVYAFLLVPFNWNPKYIIRAPIGIEDFIFCFLAGGLAWIASAWMVRKRILFNIRPALMIKRFLLCSIFGIVASGALYLVGVRGYAIPLAIMFTWGAALLFFHKRFLPLAVTGSATFALIYILMFKTIELLWPGLPSLWNLKNLWELQFWHIPLEEIAWAFLYGPAWAITTAWILDARFIKGHIEKKNSNPLTGDKIFDIK